MSDGDGKGSVKFLSEKENIQAKKKNKKSGTDEFLRAIARIALAQVCERLGFQGVQESALNALVDVGVRYIKDVGRSASLYANLENRCQCNLLDLIQGIEDLGSVQGFSGSSDVGHALSESGIVRDISYYIRHEEEIPFAYVVPNFPIVKLRRMKPSFAREEESPPYEHIPYWLPTFPDPVAHLNLNQSDNKATENLENKFQLVKQLNRKVGRPLTNVQQKLFCNGSEAEVAREQGNVAKSQQASDRNPFLVAPLQFGAKEVSLPVLPAKLVNVATGKHRNHKILEIDVSTLDPSSLTAEKAARSSPCEPENASKVILQEPSIHFKFGNGKNSVAMIRNLHNSCAEKISFWFDIDSDKKDEKKIKAKQILWENTENPQKGSHLYIRHD